MDSLTVFAALELDEAVKDYCVSLQNLLKERTAGSFPARENLHITLGYFGRVNPEAFEMLKKIFNEQPFPACTVVLDHLLVFAGKKGDQIVYAGSAPEPLVHYRNNVMRRLEEEQITYDRKPFVPHVTLVRAKRHAVPLADIALRKTEVCVRRVVLYSSYQRKNMRIYEPLWNSENHGEQETGNYEY